MKGFIKDDKFHPIRNQNGMRKSRDQYAKIEGVKFVTEGFEIIQDDEEEDNYHTIYGGNDFYDLTKPKGEQKGFTSEDAIKKAGGIEKAFFKLGSGQGFESGNPKNDYNLNNPNLKLYDPTKNEFTKST